MNALTQAELESRGSALRNAVQARLAAIVESSQDGIISKNLNGVVQTWNKGAHEMFGYTPEEAIGRPIADLIVPDDRHDEETEILAKLSQGERIENYETIRRTKNGTLIHVSVTISPVRDERGNVIGASKIARDITAQKRLLDELHTAKEAAEEAGKVKDRFLSVLSHELRTPLTPALAELAMIEAYSDLPALLKERLRMIRRNIETEARLVDDLLDLTRISREKMSLHFEAVDIHALALNCERMLLSQARDKGVYLSAKLAAQKQHVWADGGRLQQVLLNLLTNAIKFTDAGGHVTLTSTNPAAETISIAVIDDGRGIPAETLAKLFTPFEQGANSTRQGGLGLGLYIVRSLVNMHHGQVRATSAGRGRGATFTIELATIAPPSPAASRQHFELSGKAYRILLLEDHADTRDVLARFLSRLGHAVASAGTIAEALALASAGTFDLVLSDIDLPDGNGTDLMRRLRSGGIRGIALTGFGQDEDVEKTRAAGFCCHLTKPINIEMLQETIEKVMADSEPAVAALH